MGATSIWPAVGVLATAVLTAFLLSRAYRELPAHGRFVAVDGLRGFLALAVFIHHGCIWFFYLKTHRWDAPPSRLYTHLGESPLSLFFMITGFLFFSKLLENGPARPLDWTRLYVSRVLRLAPLYVAVVAAVVAVAFILSGGVLREPAGKVLVEVVRWMGFTILGGPDINGVPDTFMIVAGVTWSLPFEWRFYCLLPLLSLLMGKRPPLVFIGLGVLAAAAIAHHFSMNNVPFLGGIAAACLVRSARVRQRATGLAATLVAIACLVAAVALFPSGFDLGAVALLTVFFVIVCAGNTLFGALTTRTSRTLGEFGYGLYLIHGVVLFVVFRMGIGETAAIGFSPLQHWGIVILATPVLVIAAFLAHVGIERPAMRRVTPARQAVRGWRSAMQLRLAAGGARFRQR